MKKLIEGIPFLLLCAFAPYFFFNTPNISQAAIVASIAGLSGYRYYLDSIKQPNYVELFEEELRTIKKENREFRDKYGKMSMEQGSKKALGEAFRW